MYLGIFSINFNQLLVEPSLNPLFNLQVHIGAVFLHQTHHHPATLKHAQLSNTVVQI